jgi:hypothetical protein
MLIVKITQKKSNKLISLLILAVFFVATIDCSSQVGINTVTPLSMLDINGNLSVKVITLVGSASITNISDGVYISINPQATDQEFKLPSAITYPGRMYFIRNINNSYTAKLTAAGGMLFPKESTTGSTEIYIYEGHLRSVIVVSDGSNWTYY